MNEWIVILISIIFIIGMLGYIICGEKVIEWLNIQSIFLYTFIFLIFLGLYIILIYYLVDILEWGTFE